MVTCPNCGSRHVFQSRSGNQGFKRLLRLLVVVARCYTCNASFPKLHTFWGGVSLRKPPTRAELLQNRRAA